MRFSIIAYDHGEKNERRKRVRQLHRDYLAAYGEKLLSSAALLDETRTKIIGGVSLTDTDDRLEAIRFEADAPYALEGICAHAQIIQWRLRWWVRQFNAAGHHPSEINTHAFNQIVRPADFGGRLRVFSPKWVPGFIRSLQSPIR